MLNIYIPSGTDSDTRRERMPYKKKMKSTETLGKLSFLYFNILVLRFMLCVSSIVRV
jgi:hypothetical protein